MRSHFDARPRAAHVALMALGALSATLGPEVAQAQAPRADVGSPMALESGFIPDPLRIVGQTRTGAPLSRRAPTCRGYVGEQPSHVLDLGRFPFLRFFVVSTAEVTLAIRRPDGSWRCSGRPLEGRPREQGRFEAGRHEIWVGSVTPGAQHDYELVMTEMRTVLPSGASEREVMELGPADLGLELDAEEGRFRDRRFRRGFLPDPEEDDGEASGEIDITSLGASCDGFVVAAPSHVLELRDEFDYLRVAVLPLTTAAENQARPQLVLVLRTTAGRFLCSAPEAGPPAIDRDAWPPGRYPIWVGVRSRETEATYRVRYTEARP